MNKTMKTFWNYLENNLYFQCKDASLSAPFVFMTDKYMRVAEQYISFHKNRSLIVRAQASRYKYTFETRYVYLTS